ncbi:hypothetical protein Ga0100230_004120 [Opitutaceae bacterium TAV3]|nr:hypothetical protein Ga0100230_004120 [Opitutaceae bacterium TAV3]
MKLYFDTDAGTIVPIPGSMAALNMIKVKRADEFDVELRIYANGVQYVPDADTAWICCKNTGEYPATFPYLAVNDGLVKTLMNPLPEDATQQEIDKWVPDYAWCGRFNLNTNKLNGLFDLDGEGEGEVEKESVSVLGEVGFKKGSRETSSLVFTFKIHNDLYKGDTSLPEDAESGAASQAAERAEEAADRAEDAADRAENAIYTANPVPANAPDGAVRFKIDGNGIFFQLKSETTGAFHSVWVKGEAEHEMVALGPEDYDPNPATGFAPAAPPNGNYKFQPNADGFYMIHLKHETAGTFHPVFVSGETGSEQIKAGPAI